MDLYSIPFCTVVSTNSFYVPVGGSEVVNKGKSEREKEEKEMKKRTERLDSYFIISSVYIFHPK